MSTRAAQLISVLLNPIFNSTYTFGILVGTDGDLIKGRKLATFCVAFLFSSAVPIAHVAWLKWRGTVESLDVDQRQRRQGPLVVGILNYAVGYILLTSIQASPIVVGLMFCYATNTLLVAFITHWWKVSVHATGIAGLPAGGMGLVAALWRV